MKQDTNKYEVKIKIEQNIIKITNNKTKLIWNRKQNNIKNKKSKDKNNSEINIK